MARLWSPGWYRMPRDPHFLLLSQDPDRDIIRIMWIDGRHENVDTMRVRDAVWVSHAKNRPPAPES